MVKGHVRWCMVVVVAVQRAGAEDVLKPINDYTTLSRFWPGYYGLWPQGI